jgi:hypothetical protein
MNLKLEKLASRFLKGIFKNNPKSITIRNGTIRYSETILITGFDPEADPNLPLMLL